MIVGGDSHYGRIAASRLFPVLARMAPSCITGQPPPRTVAWNPARCIWWIREDNIWMARPTLRELWPLARRLLLGHIALATARFPEGTTGSQLDALARAPLWAVGLDYDHGTGHGVGSYLGVHEGPHRIAKGVNTVALRPGMIVSNEPGYYKHGGYGIRLENLVVVVPEKTLKGPDRPFFTFDTMTIVPFDRSLIDPTVLRDEARAWLDAYHARIWRELNGLVEGETRHWLEAATQPL
jgi:Xaa-Pro aminopeptidase